MPKSATTPIIAICCAAVLTAPAATVRGDAAHGLQEIAFVEIDAEAPHGMAVQGKYLYVAHHVPGGLTVIDVSTPSAPKKLGMIKSGSIKTYDVCVQGNYAYLADWSHQLKVVDVSDPAAPKIVASGKEAGDHYYFGIDAGDGFVCCADPSKQELAVWDVKDPVRPSILSHVAVGDKVHDVAVDAKAKRAYAAVDRGLEVIDMADPAQPRKLGTADVGGFCRWVEARGNFVYTGSVSKGKADGGLRVVDVSNPSSPRVVGRWGDDRMTTQPCVALLGNGAVFSSQYAWALDLSNPAKPREAGLLNSGWFLRCASDGKHAYFANLGIKGKRSAGIVVAEVR